MALIDLYAQAGQLLAELPRRAFAAVGQEQELLLLLFEKGNEFGRAGQQVITVVDHAIHIADESALIANMLYFHCPLLLLFDPFKHPKRNMRGNHFAFRIALTVPA
jgi:hypothetical protein